MTAWAKLVMLAALLAGVATTVAVLLSNGRSSWHAGRSARIKKDPGRFQNDREIAYRLFGLIRERDMTWLQIESFGGPWHDDHVALLREIVLFDASHSGIFDPELADAMGRLTNAARTFLHIYDGSTIADPMMRDGSWRMIARSGGAGEADVSTGRDRIGSQTRLREAAARICESHDALATVSRHKFPPD